MSRNINIGIDIGKHGAIVIDNSGVITTHKMPLIGTELDYKALNDILEPFEGGNVMVVFEKIVPYIQNKSTAFSLGHQAGAIEMLCVAHCIPYTKLPPRNWQKEMFAGVGEMNKGDGSRDTKSMALMAIKRLMPNLQLTFGKATVPHDGLVDAALMAAYAKRKL